MTEENFNDLEDLIESHTDYNWSDIKGKLHEMSTKELIDIFTGLELYVNKTLALEIAHRKDAIFYLRKLIQDSAYWEGYYTEDHWAHIHILHLLALIKTREAFNLFLDLLRYRSNDLSDWLTEDVPYLLAAFGEDFKDSIMEFTEDETLDSLVRGMAVIGIALLARKYSACENQVKEHIIKLLNNSDDSEFTTHIAKPLTMFHDISVMPVISKAYDENKIDGFFGEKKDFEDIIMGKLEDDFEIYNRDPLEYFSRKSIGHLHKIHYGKSDDDENKLIKEYQERFQAKKEEPAEKKVGRNAPCPCGSGKKYKKCCMRN
ncbi:MAG TPA: DUF1186 domain-containing protein [Candidatus Methylomirabilis sp.]|nr:DUF1186 domain-containing protein [Candidatus Methylomirabilis sp.]